MRLDRHERRLLGASHPGLPLLLTMGRYARPIRRVPGLGWVSADAGTVRRILADSGHFTIVGQGIAGHLWAEMLGGHVYDLLDGAEHRKLRTLTRDLFEDAEATVERAAGERLRRLTDELRQGTTVDIAEVSREVVGRVTADLLGTTNVEPSEVFRLGLELGALAAGTTKWARVPADTVTAGSRIVDRLVGKGTLVERCGALGLGNRETHALSALLTVAGTQTTASAMARTVAWLYDTGRQHALLADRGRIADTVRDGLRVTSAVPVITREVTEDVDIAGRRLRRGQRVLLLIRTFTNTVGPGQLWFGGGAHFCLGAPLARAQVTAMLRALLDTGKPWRIVDRKPARRVLIPAYDRLLVTVRASAHWRSTFPRLFGINAVRERAEALYPE